jgi:hypothetical protein
MAVDRQRCGFSATASRRRIRWLGETARFALAGGRLIRHARLPETMPIFPLSVTVVESSLGTRLVSTVRFTTLNAPCTVPARRAAVALASITGTTDPEQGLAISCPTNSINKNDLCGIRHPARQSGLDNGHKSWQSQNLCCGALVRQCPVPVVDGGRGHPSSFDPYNNRFVDDICACGADDVGVLSSRRVIRKARI